LRRTFSKNAFLGALLLATGAPGIVAHPSITFRGGDLKHRHGQISKQHKDHLRNTFMPSYVDLAVFARRRTIGADHVRVTYGVIHVSSVTYVSGAYQRVILLNLDKQPKNVGRFASLTAGQSRNWNIHGGIAMTTAKSIITAGKWS